MTYFIYILRTSSNTLYIGQTNNLKKRINEHKSKGGRSSKYVKSFSSFELVYWEECESLSAALKREYELKRWTKAKKEEMIRAQ